MTLPTYLTPYTKTSIEQVLSERDKAVAQRCREVGKGQTCKDTGWSMTVILNACQQNNVPSNKRGRKPNKQNLQVLESVQELPRFSSEIFTDFYSESDPGNFTEFSSGPKVPDFLKISDELMRCQHVDFAERVKNCESQEQFQNLFFSIQPPRLKISNKSANPKKLHTGIHVDQPEVLPPNSEKIQLSLGLFAIVDADMADILKRYNWSAKPDYRKVYAVSTDINNTQFKMHRIVLGLPNKGGEIVDHVNRNGLDNRRCNLTFSDPSKNGKNHDAHEKRPSRFYGVVRNTNKWCVFFTWPDGGKHKKNFDDEVEAARYYDELVKKHKPGMKTNEAAGLFSTENLDRKESP
jgi:hypothetical protein